VFAITSLLQYRLPALAVSLVASFLLLKRAARMEAPFAVFFLLASAWAIAIAVMSRREPLRSGALLCSSVLFCLALVETCLYWVGRPQIIVTQTFPQAWRRNAPGLGSLPMPNTATEFKEFIAGRLIADVTYRIDASGLREIPAAVQGRPHRIVFFGCSFMFGHGVEEDQTLPYYFVREAKGSFAGYNFAGEGWGPHQMLREIETGFVRRVAGAPDLAIYEAIPDHLRRVAGRAPWEDGPKYALCRDAEACYAGPFHSAYYVTCRHWLEQSWTVRFMETHFASFSRPSDIPLFLAVLKKTRSLLEKGGTRFVIVLWDKNDLAREMIKVLRTNGFDVIALSSIVSENDLKKHPLTQLDRHPSPATNKAIATYLWEQIGERLVTAHAKPSAPRGAGF
jgi:hypothetical protein